MKQITLLSLAISICLFACKKDPDAKPSTTNTEHDAFTTILVSITDSSTNATKTYKVFYDKDGNDTLFRGTHPDTIKLDANKTYFAQVIILNENANPVDTNSNEIKSNPDVHQLFYEPDGVQLNITKTDKDHNGNALGLKSTWHTAGTSKGHSHIHLVEYTDATQKKNDPNNENIGETFFEEEAIIKIQ